MTRTGIGARLWSPRVLDLLSGALLLVAVAARFAPVSAPMSDDAAVNGARSAWAREGLDQTAAGGALDRTGGTRAAGTDSSPFAGIVTGNVFSPSRRAPTSRFVSPLTANGGEGATSVPDAAMTAPPATIEDATAGDAVPRLYGVVSVDGERRALLALHADRPPRLMRVGDRDGLYRLLAIDVDQVRVQTPGGVRTLRLVRAAPAGAASTGAAGDTLIPHP